MLGFESFCVHGFCAVYPRDWRVKLDAESRRGEGSVAFVSPDGERVVVRWGPLERVEESYSGLEEQVKDSIDRIREESRVEEMEVVETRDVRVNSHRGILSHCKMKFSTRRFRLFGRGKILVQEVRSLHFYCKTSGRYFVVYGVTKPDHSERQSQIFKSIMRSFICHRATEKSVG